MQSPIILSIVIVTMNRKAQLLEALESCVECSLPDGVEFIVIDNASTDGTDTAVAGFFADRKGYSWIYKFLPENKGVGGGRNEGVDIAQGGYIYFLDDDAVIDDACKDSFFIKAIEIMDNKPTVATLTTRIWDEMLQCDRLVIPSKETKVNGHSIISMFLGGSHFIRRAAFDQTIYPEFKYGFEEIIPSFHSIDKGLCNLYVPELAIIHKPIVNKWADGSRYRNDIVIKNIAGIFASKYLLYPVIFRPLLFAAFIARWYIHLRKCTGAFNDCYALFKSQTEGVRIRKIRSATVIKILREFGFGAGV